MVLMKLVTTPTLWLTKENKMTVADLIERLRAMPQDLPVCVNDECGGTFHENIDFVYRFVPDEGNPYDDLECVVITVNECV